MCICQSYPPNYMQLYLNGCLPPSISKSRQFPDLLQILQSITMCVHVSSIPSSTFGYSQIVQTPTTDSGSYIDHVYLNILTSDVS